MVTCLTCPPGGGLHALDSLQVPDYMSVSDLHFFIGSKSVYAEEYMEVTSMIGRTLNGW
jgi:hypothetical protein